MTDASNRPPNVDGSAKYDDDEDEWVLEAPRGPDGQPNGMTRRWRESGELLLEQSYEHGRPTASQYFHPDGALAMEESFADGGMIARRTRYAPAGDSDIAFPSGGLDERITKVEYGYDEHGYMTGFTGWAEDGAEITREAISRSLDGETEQRAYESVDAAANEWNTKGEKFYADLNAYILSHFVDDGGRDDDDDHDHDDDDGGHPMDERGHMERYVLDALAEANREGRGATFRETFRPAFEPFSDPVWTGLGRHVRKVHALDDGALATVGDRVYRLSLDAIELQKDALAFGASPDGSVFARCSSDQIVLTQGWGGRTLRTFDYPSDYGPAVRESSPSWTPQLNGPEDLEIMDVVVDAQARFVLLATRRGIFLLEERVRPLFPHPALIAQLVSNAESEGELQDLEIDVDDPRVAMSNDQDMLVVSGQCGPWAPLRFGVSMNGLDLGVRQQDGWPKGPIGPTVFRRDGEHMLISLVEHEPSFFGMGGGTETHVLTPTMSKIAAVEGELLADYQGQVMMRTEDIHAACEFGDGFLLGMGDCYLWQQDIDVNSQRFVFVGATGQVGVISSVDASPDGKTIWVGTDYGAILRFGVQDEVGAGFITNLPLRDERRYLFLDTFDPMLW